MTYKEAEQAPEILALKPQLDAVGIDYSASVERAVNEAHKAVPIQAIATNDKEQIISFVVGFLVNLIDEKMATKPKTKGGKIARFFWGIFRIFGGKGRVIKEANKL